MILVSFRLVDSSNIFVPLTYAATLSLQRHRDLLPGLQPQQPVKQQLPPLL